MDRFSVDPYETSYGLREIYRFVLTRAVLRALAESVLVLYMYSYLFQFFINEEIYALGRVVILPAKTCFFASR